MPIQILLDFFVEVGTSEAHGDESMKGRKALQVCVLVSTYVVILTRSGGNNYRKIFSTHQIDYFLCYPQQML